MTIEPVPLRLIRVIERFDELAVAVSGGVDSMVLAHVVHGHTRTRLVAFHAASPAVPASATERVRIHAQRFGWQLRVVDAGELDDPTYRANPVDRCFFCKSRLYDRIRAVADFPTASGTNLDDLGDYRPGLRAAEDHRVIHPFVEAGLAKRDVYALAAALGLDDLAALPAQPCLASRIETGLVVDATTLAFVERVEAALAPLLPRATHLRCRVTATGVVVEADPLPTAGEDDGIVSLAARLCREGGRSFAGLRRYRRGSAFLHPTADLVGERSLG
ncbi:MAG: adenine nucleotide alpha hydrolase [Proteobacteria bacterium]|nr:adenine nucleotide alpha hydrolase [Pseudomonadota bacterium]